MKLAFILEHEAIASKLLEKLKSRNIITHIFVKDAKYLLYVRKDQYKKTLGIGKNIIHTNFKYENIYWADLNDKEISVKYEPLCCCKLPINRELNPEWGSTVRYPENIILFGQEILNTFNITAKELKLEQVSEINSIIFYLQSYSHFTNEIKNKMEKLIENYKHYTDFEILLCDIDGEILYPKEKVSKRKL